MNKALTQSRMAKKTMTTKLVMGLMVAAVSVFVSTAGVANAMGTGQSNTPPSKQACKDGGWQHFTDENGMPFKNQGLCIKWANEHDHGYGGGNVGGNIDISVGDIIGDNNVVNIVVNYFVGR